VVSLVVVGLCRGVVLEKHVRRLAHHPEGVVLARGESGLLVVVPHEVLDGGRTTLVVALGQSLLVAVGVDELVLWEDVDGHVVQHRDGRGEVTSQRVLECLVFLFQQVPLGLGPKTDEGKDPQSQCD